MLKYLIRWNDDQTYLISVRPSGLFEWGPKAKAKEFNATKMQDILRRTGWRDGVEVNVESAS